MRISLVACARRPGITRRPSIATRLIAALAMGLILSTMAGAGPAYEGVHIAAAQPGGCNLVTAGCRLEVGSARQAVLDDASTPHVWLLHLDSDENVLIGTSCVADAPYRIYAYGPDRQLVEVNSSDPGQGECAAIILTGPQPGEYQVIVDSPTGATSPDAYRIYAVLSRSQPGMAVFTDSLADQEHGVFAVSSTPGLWYHDYRDGEFAIEVLDPNSYGRTSWLPFTDTSATLAVDIRVLDNSPGWSATLSCRESDEGYYRLIVDPWESRWSIDLCQEGDCEDLTNWQPNLAIRPDASSNRVELTCQGARLSARINGVDVGGATDTTLSEGSFGVGSLRLSDDPMPGEVRFRNLSLTER
jgi:hypothetical protein